jgi:hypothetical protein
MNVYWTDYDVGTVMKAPKSREWTMDIASGQPGAGASAIDDTSVYWSNYDWGPSDGFIMKAPKQISPGWP